MSPKFRADMAAVVVVVRVGRTKAPRLEESVVRYGTRLHCAVSIVAAALRVVGQYTAAITGSFWTKGTGATCHRRSVSWKWFRSAGTPHPTGTPRRFLLGPCPHRGASVPRRTPCIRAAATPSDGTPPPVLEQQPELGDEAEHGRTQTVSDPHAKEAAPQRGTQTVSDPQA